MPAFAEKLPNEPIIILAVSDPSDKLADEMKAAYVDIARWAVEIDGPYIRITDATGLNITFGEFVKVLSAASTSGPGSASDPNATTLLVATDDLVKFAAEALAQEQYGNLNIGLFESRDDALAHARAEIARWQRTA